MKTIRAETIELYFLHMLEILPLMLTQTSPDYGLVH